MSKADITSILVKRLICAAILNDYHTLAGALKPFFFFFVKQKTNRSSNIKALRLDNNMSACGFSQTLRWLFALNLGGAVHDSSVVTSRNPNVNFVTEKRQTYEKQTKPSQTGVWSEAPCVQLGWAGYLNRSWRMNYKCIKWYFSKLVARTKQRLKAFKRQPNKSEDMQTDIDWSTREGKNIDISNGRLISFWETGTASCTINSILHSDIEPCPLPT